MAQDVWHLMSNAFTSGYIDLKLAKTLIVPIPKVDVALWIFALSVYAMSSLRLFPRSWCTTFALILKILLGLFRTVLFPIEVLRIMLLLLKRLFTICTRRRKVRRVFPSLRLILKKPYDKVHYKKIGITNRR